MGRGKIAAARIISGKQMLRSSVKAAPLFFRPPPTIRRPYLISHAGGYYPESRLEKPVVS
jgi:hypothetical protein